LSGVIYRDLRSAPPVAVRGEGIRIVDSDGRMYIDASSGAAVSALGHSDPDVRAAIISQLNDLAYAHTSFFTTAVQEELAAHLVEAAPGDLSHVYFVSGGSEAMETALKIARQYFVESGQPQRHRFISRRHSYHGNTLGALGVGGNAARREIYDPILVPSTQVAAC
jgi:adenosylmethionine-8-amino-7-oxononanoate aminotransferase